MSVALMALVFKCNMPELKTDKGQTVSDSTAKFVLLSLADHANDEGEGAYPSVKTICQKTNLSIATVVNALNALRTNGFAEMVGKSKRGTCNYTISATRIGAFQWLESADSSGYNATVLVAENKPLVNHPIKPSIKKAGHPKASDIPELVLYREVVKHWPKPFQRETVVQAVRQVSGRLGRPVTKDDLSPFWTAWGGVSGNEWSLVWLTEWAVSGEIPQRSNGNGHRPTNTQPDQPKLSPDELERKRAAAAAHVAQLQAEGLA